jgi:hypothetical protein
MTLLYAGAFSARNAIAEAIRPETTFRPLNQGQSATSSIAGNLQKRV